ncbi:hypothetical protein JQM84_12605 [Parabacteroides distasonis]|nr:hypothetical protein [Parabacteroides distasonis]
MNTMDLKTLKRMSRLFIAILAGLSLLGCKPYKVAQRDTVIRDSLYITQRMIDRVLIRDSVYERHVHDTVYKYKERETVRYLAMRDTLYVERRDSVSVPYPVERELTKLEATRMRLGDILLVIVNIGIIYVVIWMIRRRKR